MFIANVQSVAERIHHQTSQQKKKILMLQRDMRSSVYWRSTVCKKKKSQASVSESRYLKTDLCHLRAATLRRCVEQEQAEFGWWIEHILVTVNIASL